MTKISFILIFTFFGLKLWATECVDRTFFYDHLTLNLCQNYSNYRETRVILYKARAKQLNEMIESLIAEGKMADKKFQIAIYDEVLTYNYCNISQSKTECYINCSGFLSFRELAELVNYFTQNEWQSFVYDPSEVKDQQETRELLKSIIQQYPQPDLNQYLSKKSVVWQEDSLKLIYTGDSLTYFFDSRPLPYAANIDLPVKIKDRYLFFQSDDIVVYENGSEILRYQHKQPWYEEDFSEIRVHANWVNIGGDSDQCLYSYSYVKNKFYKISE